METVRWRTVVAFTTRFEAQMAADRLDDAMIPSRIVSDGGNETLPHMTFGTGGHRVQVDGDDEEVARQVLHEQAGTGSGEDATPRLRRQWTRLIAAVLGVAVAIVLILEFRPLLS